MGIREFLPKHHSELLLKYDEFVDAWLEVLEASHRELCNSDVVRDAVGEDDGLAAHFLATSRIVLLVVAMRAWRLKPRMREKVRGKVEASVVSAFLGSMPGGGLDVEEAWDVYRANLDFFDRMLQDAKQDEQGTYAQCALLAKYLTDACFKTDPHSCDEVLQQLAISLAACSAACERLALSSIVDGNTMFSAKPRFIVLQR